jgi:hypothetical protein
VHNTTTEKAAITAYPNPATGSTVTIDVPASWKNFFVEVFDIQGRLMTSARDERQVNVSSYASGNYLARIMCGEKTAYVQFVK